MDNRHGRRRGGFEQAKVGDTVAFGEQAAGDYHRHDILGKLVSVDGNLATLSSGEVVVHREVVQVPTPEHIATQCELFQAGWTRAERKRRWWTVVEPLAVDDVTYHADILDLGHRGPEGT